MIDDIQEMELVDVFNHLTGDPESDRYQLKADVRELYAEIRNLRETIEGIQTELDVWKRLAKKNGEEADALRVAGGVSCDDTIQEGIDKIAALRAKS